MGLKRDERGRFKKIPVPPKGKLEELYLRENKTPYKIAQIFKVSSNTVRRWLHYYHIPIKRPYLSNVKTRLSETEKAYLAGYLDGDGTINVGFSKKKGAIRGIIPRVEVSLMTKHKDFALQLQQMIGGKVKTFIYEDSRAKKQGYRLVFTNQASVLAFLEAVEPYLLLKKKQAELAIRYLRKRLKARREKGNNAPISDEDWSLLEEIRRLNRACWDNNLVAGQIVSLSG